MSILKLLRPCAFAVLLFSVVQSAGCGRTETQTVAGLPSAGTVTVVCTTGMIADAARIVGGDRITVTALMGPGTDPHLYTPTRTDLAAVMEADLVLYNGLHLEGRMIDALERAASSGRRVVAVAESMSEDQLLSPPEFAGLNDPHVWMDPSTWSSAVDSVQEALIAAAPEHASEFAASAAAYRDTLFALDAYARDTLDTIPPSARVLVTAHDAFNYLGRGYNLEVVGIQGLSTESEAGVRDIERLVNLLVDRQVPAVFVESTVSERNIRALIDGASARGHEVVIGGSLFSDAMGTGGTYEGTYQGMIDHNVTTIVRALGGQAPERGMVGRLGEDSP